MRARRHCLNRCRVDSQFANKTGLMSDAANRQPAIDKVAFECPHCAAFTSQTWYELYARARPSDQRTPLMPNPVALEEIRNDKEMKTDLKERMVEYFTKLNAGLVFLERSSDGRTLYLELENLHISQCFVCQKIAIWVKDQLAHPAARTGPAANEDLPEDILRDYNEASSLVAISPRGAAALLRLAIQKLCVHLGGKGKSIDEDIARLVQLGLAPLVQRALDAVRVIGNEAVHPGTLDLKDDVDTANKLFRLVNVIAEQMISNPKHVNEIYAKIPDAKLKAIESRDSKTGEEKL
jgi:hypothetical protein